MTIQVAIQANESNQALPSEEDLCNFIKHLVSHAFFADIADNSILSLVLIDDNLMKKLNMQYRNQKKTTDVLSFGISEMTPMGYLWGEVFISPVQAKVNADEKKISLIQELKLLIIHALVHLKGYDHENDEQLLIMQKHENELFNFISRGDC